MGMDFSVAGFIAAGGGVAYLLVAVLWAVSRGRPLERLLVAALLAVLGVFVILQSLTTPEAESQASLNAAERAGLHLIGWSAVSTSVLGAALALVVARKTSRRTLLGVALMLVAILLLAVTSIATGGIIPGKGDPSQMPEGTHAVYVIFLAAYAATAVGAMALALRWKSDPTPAMAWLAAGLAVLPVATLLWGATRSWAEALFGLIGLVCVLAWLPPWPGPARAPRGILWGLLAWGLFYEMYALLPFLGSGAALLAPFEVAAGFAIAFALLRHRAWGIQPPDFAARRGALTAAALATLFIVAQVVQNFLSAEYGLLTGGIIAGSFLFAAQPVQRALERHALSRARNGSGEVPAEGTNKGPGEPAATAKGAMAQEQAFRSAVALAYKDRRFTPKEELALADLAEQLGVGVRRAIEIRQETERARGGR